MFAQLSFSQSTGVEIIVDSKIDLLLEKELNTSNLETDPQIKGYRVQVYFDQNKTLIDKAKQEFILLQPDVPTYVVYNAPNYILKAGNFRTKLEAKELQHLMLETFPTCFVIQEKIFLPSVTPVIKTED